MCVKAKIPYCAIAVRVSVEQNREGTSPACIVYFLFNKRRIACATSRGDSSGFAYMGKRSFGRLLGGFWEAFSYVLLFRLLIFSFFIYVSFHYCFVS